MPPTPTTTCNHSEGGVLGALKEEEEEVDTSSKKIFRNSQDSKKTVVADGTRASASSIVSTTTQDRRAGKRPTTPISVNKETKVTLVPSRTTAVRNDPVVRAVNTVMYGCLVHWWATHNTTWIRSSMQGEDHGDGGEHNSTTNDVYQQQQLLQPWQYRILICLLLHEYWVFLQHANVLGNPHCQHLDRQYGIALLQNNRHWAIAGTLSAYWCRESLSMFLCLPFVHITRNLRQQQQQQDTNRTTYINDDGSSIIPIYYFIIYSLVYHMLKSRGVRENARTGSSSAWGVLSLVMDEFYWHKVRETLYSASRLFLQGLDTYIHFRIVCSLVMVVAKVSVVMDNSNIGATTGLSSSYSIDSVLHAWFAIWVFHAAVLNQLWGRSTATIMVQAWNKLSCVKSTRDAFQQSRTTTTKPEASTMPPVTVKDKKLAEDFTDIAVVRSSDGSSDEEHETRQGSGIHDIDCDSAKMFPKDEYLVRQLLRVSLSRDEKRNNDTTKVVGEGGAAMTGVDTAVRVETVVSILSIVFFLLGDTPMRALVTPCAIPNNSMAMIRDWFSSLLASFTTADIGAYSVLQQEWNKAHMHDAAEKLSSIASPVFNVVPYAWLTWSILYGIWSQLLRTVDFDRQHRSQIDVDPAQSRETIRRARRRVMLQLLDIAILFFTTIQNNCKHVQEKYFSLILSIAGLVAYRAFLQTSCIGRPKIVTTSLLATEFVGKAIVTRNMASGSNQDSEIALVGSCIALLWGLWVVCNPTPTPCEIKARTRTIPAKVADAVFLGHPAELSDCWALWLIPYSLKERWQCPWWAVPLWPMHYLVGWYVCNFRQPLFGNSASFFCCDEVGYEPIKLVEYRLQTWTATHFARHFFTHPRQVQRNIVAAARHAERIGVKVLCLGALNKAESINGGGIGVVQALGPQRRISVIHGNHLTAAAVVRTTHACFGSKARVFLTGASSKVGWAVALALRDRYGFDILCHSTDHGRRAYFESQGFRSTNSLADGTLYSKQWIVGKYDRRVANLIPHNATAVVFSVPHPLERRKDVRIIEAGTLHLDLTKLDRPRQFTNKLRHHEVFACHAASIVAAHRLHRDGLTRIDETGPVDPDVMDSWLDDAEELGLQIPPVTSVQAHDSYTANGERSIVKNSKRQFSVVVVGAGPSGLATAASLARRDIPVTILESEEDPNKFGSWENHFSGLEITTQKKWCDLPGFSIMDGKPVAGDYLTASDYRRYLQLYAARFGLEIRRGSKVMSIEKGIDVCPWIVSVKGNSTENVAASAVVVATGKHRIPNYDTDDDLCGKLRQAGISYLHTAELRDSATWSRVFASASRGRLCIVGFGNSAADVCTTILRTDSGSSTRKIHVAARTVPPVFPRQHGSILTVDTLGSVVRRLPVVVQNAVIRLLCNILPSSRQCNAAFPAHLPRWSTTNGRVPVIDKYEVLATGLQSGAIVGHGPVLAVSTPSNDNKTKTSEMKAAGCCCCLTFQDSANNSMWSAVGAKICASTEFDLVVFATGYQQHHNEVATREDRLNGLYKCGLGNDRLLPLKSIGEEAERIAAEIHDTCTF